MIDPWKFNPLSELGKKASKLSEVKYTEEIISSTPNILKEIKKSREAIKNGTMVLIVNSNELFL